MGPRAAVREPGLTRRPDRDAQERTTGAQRELGLCRASLFFGDLDHESDSGRLAARVG